MAAAPVRRESAIRQGLGYPGLFGATFVLAVSATSLMGGLPSGDVATRFLLKLATVSDHRGRLRLLPRRCPGRAGVKRPLRLNLRFRPGARHVPPIAAVPVTMQLLSQPADGPPA